MGLPVFLSWRISPPKRSRRLPVDPGELQRLAVCDCAVAIGALKENRVDRGNLVEFFAS